MFRASKKRPKASATRVRLLEDDDDDDNDGGSPNLERDDAKLIQVDRKVGKAKRHRPVNLASATASTTATAVTRSFDEQPEDDVDSIVPPKARDSGKRRRRQHGLGFGGGFIADTESKPKDSENDAEEEEQGSHYGKDALSKLRAEQQAYVRPVAAAAVADDPDSTATTAASNMDASHVSSSKSTSRHGQDGAGVQKSLVDTVTEPLPSTRVLPAATPTEDFIAFSADGKKASSTSILAGDEALSFIKQLEQHQDGGRSFGNAVHDGDEDEFQRKRVLGQQQPLDDDNDDVDADDNWETEVARRAGVAPPKSTDPINESSFIPADTDISPSADFNHKGSNSRSTAVLGQVRTQIIDTLEQLEAQDADLELRMQRRTGDIDSNTDSARRHELETATSRATFEFFQAWGKKLIPWVGALRELHAKVEPILQALHDLEAEKAAVSRWCDWENDIIAVLQEHGYVEQVIGRQPPAVPPPAAVLPEAATVDEFGRDVKSQHVLQRDKRTSRRRRIQKQRQSALRAADDGETMSMGHEKFQTVALMSPYIRGDESDAFVSDGEDETFRERHKSLKKAIAVVMDELDEEYTGLHNLAPLFAEWHRAYPDEYKQCFASLSFADMVGVLIQAELCALNDPWDESGGYNEAKWTASVHEALTTGTLDQPAVERLLQKWVFPTVLDLAVKSGISLTSCRQSRALGLFISHVQKLLPAESSTWSILLQPLTTSVSRSLADIAIPIVGAAPDQPSGLDDVNEALFAGTWGQLHRIKKTISNLLSFWAPVMQMDMEFCDLVLHFVSNKFVYLLSSLRGKVEGGLAETPAEIFRVVYQRLNKSGWLEYPEFGLQAALIHAAASAFNVT